MAQRDARRVSVNIDDFANYARDDQAEQALRDIFEEDMGLGYSEMTYTNNVFVSEIATYTDNSKTQLRTKTSFTYAPIPFVSVVTKEYFKEDEITAYRTLTAAISYNANKTVNNIDVQVI